MKILLFLVCSLPLLAAPPRTAIIKGDDVKGPNPKWDRYFEIAHERGIPVTAGVIADSLESQDERYVAWLKKWAATGKVEFWNHGWDHKRWKDGETEKSEFGGSGYDHQFDHLKKAQTALGKALGTEPVTLGTPFNAMDDDTAKALNELPALNLVFCYPGAPPTKKMEGKILLPMTLRGEADGTGKPNFEKFKAEYAKRDKPELTLAAIQFHPPYFSDQGFIEYTAILDFLKAEGWTFMLPQGYAALDR